MFLSPKSYQNAFPRYGTTSFIVSSRDATEMVELLRLVEACMQVRTLFSFRQEGFISAMRG
jgi:hypothetical protein